MKLTDRIPPFKPRKPMWSTRPRRPEQLAIAAGSVAVNALPGGLSGKGPKEDDAMCKVAFEKGVRNFFDRTARLRRNFYRFTTTPNWEGHRRACEGAHDVLK